MFYARTKVQCRLWLDPSGRFATGNRKHEAATYATRADGEAAIREHVHPAHWDLWEVVESGP